MRIVTRFISIPVLSILILSVPYAGLSQEVDERTALLGALHYAQEAFGRLVHLHTEVLVDCDRQPQAFMFLLGEPESPLLNNANWKDPLSLYRGYSKGEGIVTVVAGANTSHVPVIQMHRGWPDYILNITRIMKLIEELTAAGDWEVAGHVYPAPLELWVEMHSPNRGESLFVRTSDMAIMDQEAAKRLCYSGLRARSGVHETERNERIRKKWEFVQGLSGDRDGSAGGGRD